MAPMLIWLNMKKYGNMCEYCIRGDISTGNNYTKTKQEESNCMDQNKFESPVLLFLVNAITLCYSNVTMLC